MARAHQLLPSPPPDFPVYGVQPWPGARWLDSYGDIIGEEVRWVRLAHGAPGSGSVIEVETHSRPGGSSLPTVASGIANVLVNLTLPATSLPRPPGLLSALAHHGCEQSDRFAQWPAIHLRVGNAPAMARVWRFADGWAAVSDAVPGVYLAVAAVGIDPSGIELAELREGADYNFDLGQRACEIERPRHWHVDQLRLIHETGETGETGQ